jgi:hypothetical protein
MEGVFERGMDEWELGLDIVLVGADVLPDMASVDWRHGRRAWPEASGHGDGMGLRQRI